MHGDFKNNIMKVAEKLGKDLYKLLWFTIGSSIVIIGVFALFFLDLGISSNPKDWAGFATYFSGILSPILAFINIVVLINIAYLVDKWDNKKLSRTLLEKEFGSLIDLLLGSYYDKKDLYKLRELKFKLVRFKTYAPYFKSHKQDVVNEIENLINSTESIEGKIESLLVELTGISKEDAECIEEVFPNDIHQSDYKIFNEKRNAFLVKLQNTLCNL